MEACLIKDRKQWNDYIEQSAQCNMTQLYEWGDLALAVGSEPLYIGVVDDRGELCAAMQVLVSRLPIFNVPYMVARRGPIIRDPNSPAMALLLDFVRCEARKRGAFMFKIEPEVGESDNYWQLALQHYGFRTASQAILVRHEWVLDIRPDEQALLKQMKERCRYNIRLAGRKGVTIRQGDGQADLDAFYRLHQLTSERSNFFIHNKAHYELFMRLFKEDDRVVLFLAEYEGQVIAAAIVLRCGEWCWYMYSGSADEHRNVKPNHLLQWHIIRWARAHGCSYYNFLGIPDVLDDSHELWGVYLFKRSFGGHAIHWMIGQDLVYNPLMYALYRGLLDLKGWRQRQLKEKVLAGKKATAHGVAEVKKGVAATATGPL